jgi:hypothetical protein
MENLQILSRTLTSDCKFNLNQTEHENSPNHLSVQVCNPLHVLAHHFSHLVHHIMRTTEYHLNVNETRRSMPSLLQACYNYMHRRRGLRCAQEHPSLAHYYSQVLDKRTPDQRFIPVTEGVLARRPFWVLSSGYGKRRIPLSEELSGRRIPFAHRVLS